DHLMKISHVIRGEEWLTSVPKHILLYDAFGWEKPEFAHVPLILNADRTKLSKRQGDVATEDFLKKGYLKEALINYIALLGWNPGEGIEREIYSLNELAGIFSIENINSAGAIFNIEKLNWMNAEYIKNYDIDNLLSIAKPFLLTAGYDISDEEKNKRVLFATRTYINKLDEIPEVSKIYYTPPSLNPEQEESLSGPESKKILNALLVKIKSEDEISVENFKKIVKEVQGETGIKGKSLFQPVRFCLTGQEHGPDLGLIAYVLGKKEVMSRIQKYAV
ncbi:MAG: glutamate--tRNA ligase, partial [Ignavibacteria bacterium]